MSGPMPEFTLLVVDDDASNRYMLSRRLERAGYRVIVAEDGYKAIGVVETEAVDLVLLDIMMPGIDGLRVLEQLRRSQSPAQLPVIMASAIDESETVVRAIEGGANDYVTKPLDFPVVLARVAAQLRQRPAVPQTPDPHPDEIRPGSVLGARYRLGELLGEGGFGKVYRARHLELELDVAVKVLHARMTREPEIVERFRREGVSTARVLHPNAVSIYDFHLSDGGPAYLVMELLRGVTVGGVLGLSGSVSPKRAAEILVPVCDVLATAHAAGVVHRDIKPENLFLHRFSSAEIVKVLDFGIAGMLDASPETERLTRAGALLGTPIYMAPEQLFGEPCDGRADVYSLGVLLSRMLTGAEPFQGLGPRGLTACHQRGDLPDFGEAIPDEIAEVVLSALHKEPGERPDAPTLAEAFVAALPEGSRPGVTGSALQLPTIANAPGEPIDEGPGG